jgi:hypothetical protein
MGRTPDELAVPGSRLAALVAGVILLVGAIALAVWHAQHPAPLPVEDRTVSASTPVGEPVYVGVADGIGSRTLQLSGVKVSTTSNTMVDVVPLLCRDGRIEATTDPDAFCAALVNPEGQTLEADDSIVLRVSSDEPAIAVIDPVRLGFRDGLQWGTLPTGAGAVVRVLAR